MKYKTVILAVLVAVMLRAVLGYALYGGGHDINGYNTYAETVLGGGNLYSLNPVFNYAPPWMFILVFLKQVSLSTPLPFYFLVKVPAMIADALMVAALYFLSSESNRRRFAWAYALNPVSIMVTSVLPMFDSTALLFAMLAFLVMVKFSSMKAAVASAALLAAGILMKTFPIILFPLLVLKQPTWARRVVYAAVTVILVVAIASPLMYFNEDSRRNNAVWKSTIGYTGPAGMGYQKVFLAAETAFTSLGGSPSWVAFKGGIIRRGNFVTLAAVGLLTLFAAPFMTALAAAVAVFATFYFFTTGFGPQYLVWIIPFGILRGGRFFKWYTILATTYLVATAITWRVWINPPLFVQLPSPAQYVSGVAAIALWLLCGAWAFYEAKRALASFSVKKLIGAWLLRKS